MFFASALVHSLGSVRPAIVHFTTRVAVGGGVVGGRGGAVAGGTGSVGMTSRFGEGLSVVTKHPLAAMERVRSPAARPTGRWFSIFILRDVEDRRRNGDAACHASSCAAMRGVRM